MFSVFLDKINIYFICNKKLFNIAKDIFISKNYLYHIDINWNFKKATR